MAEEAKTKKPEETASEKKPAKPKAEKPVSEAKAAKPAAKKPAAKKPAADTAEKKPAAKKPAAEKADEGEKPAAEKKPAAKKAGASVVVAAAKKEEKKLQPGTLRVTLQRALSGHTQKQQAVAASLGLRRAGDVSIQPDNDPTRGKIAKISFLLKVEHA